METVDDLEYMIKVAKRAQEIYSSYSQEMVDRVFQAVAMAAVAHRLELAKDAVAETGIGLVEDKVIKIQYAAEYTYNKYRDMKTCGIIDYDDVNGIYYIAEPVGVVAAILPVTNPISTLVHNALIAVKTRNAIIFCPHPRAKKCSYKAAEILHRAAVEAGAPEGIIQCIREPSKEIAQKLMSHPDIDLIIATGGKSLVRAAYSSGNPALGVGPGNVPVFIDETADIRMAANYILMSKTFDWGILCCAESTIITLKSIADRVRRELEKLGAYFLKPDEAKAIENVIFTEDNRVRSDVVGVSARKIAELAGIKVPPDTRVLVVELPDVGRGFRLSAEKLVPVLAFHVVESVDEAIEKCRKVLEYDGLGHTAIVYSKRRDVIERFYYALKASRILVNTPGSFGGVGDIFNFKLEPSMTLGCGTWGKNIVTDNIGPKHLLNIKRVVDRRENMLWLKVPPRIYFRYGCLEYAFNDELKGRRRNAILLCDPVIYSLYAKRVRDILEDMGLDVHIYYRIKPEPSIDEVVKALEATNEVKPDTIVALGGGSVLDVAKGVWLLYEQPKVDLRSASLRFMDIRKRVYRVEPLGRKAIMVAIPTTSGTGSEVTPFLVLKDSDSKIKLTIVAYEVTPTVAVVDPYFVEKLPKRLVAVSGFDALTHALEAYVSVYATEFTDPLALQALKLIFRYLPESYEKGTLEAREKMHYAATIAGMAFANAFLGVGHSMAHVLGSVFDIPHGLACALVVSQVVKYNAVWKPLRNTAFPQYKYYSAPERYAEIADYLGLGGKTVEEKVMRLIEAINDLKRKVGLPMSIKELGISEDKFMEKLDFMAETAFNDQCTSTNPRHPLISELKELFIKAYYGEV